MACSNETGMFYYYGKTKLVSIKIIEMGTLSYLICIKFWKHWKSFHMEKAYMCIRKLTVVMGELKP